MTQAPRDDSSVLHDALASAQRGSGAVVILSASAGAGAGQLLHATTQDAAARGAAVMRTRGRASERALPFGAAVELFEATWSQELDAAQRTALSAGPARAAAELLEGAPGAAGGGDEDAGFAIIRGLSWLARRLAERPAPDGDGPRGLAIAIDELHDLDGPTLRFLGYLSGRIDRAPIAILATLRPGLPTEDPQALSALTGPARVVRPPSLTPPQVVARIRAALPGASPRFCAACAGASAGNPGLLDELLGELVQRGTLPSDGQAERLAEIVPERVVAEVDGQLARLSPAAQSLARAVAGLGDGAPLERARVAAQLSDAETPAALDALVATEMLLPGVPLSYSAPLVRRAVQASLTVGQRLELGRTMPDQVARPRTARRPGAGIDALTPSERRVGELAARGMTTREIAATLFVTTKTVEFHLRNVYRKLDVPSSRAELTRILGRPPVDDAIADSAGE